MIKSEESTDPYDMLMNYNGLKVRQRPRGWCKEICCNWETENVYDIYDKDNKSHKVGIAREQSSCCCRCCCSNYRSFQMNVFSKEESSKDQNILRIERPYHCHCPCLPCSCCRQLVRVYHPISNDLLGTVEEECWCCVPSIQVLDSTKHEQLHIDGPSCCRQLCCCACGRYAFKIRNPDSDETMGKITKTFSGVAKEAFTDADNFKVDFNQSFDAPQRGLLFAATVLIDFLFFEDNNSATA
mmetsp:Transcript_14729/g.21991  ORF Transcript_14729/g.21991 Transcript_14729/m.21991 type:complete len:241 (-) Transcript_14729:42-764(-)